MTVMPEIQFVPGKFLLFRARIKVHLGRLAKDILEGDVAKFDGQTLILGGTEYPFPEFRAGIKTEWFVLLGEEDNISAYKPKSSDVKVRSAKDGKVRQSPTTVTSDEVEIRPARLAKPVPETKRAFRADVIDQDVTEREVGPSRRVTRAALDATGNEDARTVGRIGSPKSETKPHVLETRTPVSTTGGAEEGTPVAKIGSPAKMRTVISDGAQAARETERIDNRTRTAAKAVRSVLPAKSGEDVHAASAEKVEEILDVLEPENRAKAVAQTRRALAEESAKKAGFVPVQKVEAPKVEAPKVEAPKVEAPKSPKVEAPKIKQPRTIEEVVLAGDELDLGDGLKWDMSLHWLVRVKKVCDLYGDKPELFEKVLAVESEAVRKHARINLGFRQGRKAG